MNHFICSNNPSHVIAGKPIYKDVQSIGDRFPESVLVEIRPVCTECSADCIPMALWLREATA